MKKYIMALDQGTTSSRCILFDRDGVARYTAQREFPQIFKNDGWVEHDPLTIWSTQAAVATEALMMAGSSFSEVYAVGITNQRETCIAWNKKTGEPVYNAIVWQCRRTAEYCEHLRSEGYASFIKEKTGLLIDPYFSATKLKWMLDNVEGLRELAERGELAFGTVDSWLIYKLTGGKRHVTDVSNASRTMLFNLHTMQYDSELLSLFGIPKDTLPEVLPSSSVFGYTDPSLFGAEVPIASVLGDQQAALFGQCCFASGDVKNTYGTGAFLLMNVGKTPRVTRDGLLTTVGWQIGDEVTYALEGSVFTCGAAIQWLRDGMKLIESAPDSEYYARKVKDSGGVIVVPAFTGLGAPCWDPYARGLIIGINRGTTKNHIIRATLESLAYQTNDVITLMREASGLEVSTLRVDGGASQNSLLLQIQADLSDTVIERPAFAESTALGCAMLAGLTVGLYSSLDEISALRKDTTAFTPCMSQDERERLLSAWCRARDRALGWANP
ncbi:MAG: glycerol kinase GlpK [Clostridia bacterium]|nr:glycerol kinase GlpK [Clostridia bacterium]